MFANWDFVLLCVDLSKVHKLFGITVWNSLVVK